MDSTKTFFITGVSSGFGRAIANAALSAGHRVVGTVREEQAAAEFERRFPGQAHARLLDDYCGSKFALESISEAFGKEVKDFGIAVTAIAPGSFRTDWAGRSMVRSARHIADYDALFAPVRQARIDKSGKQLGDPDKAAQAVLKVVGMAEPPEHLLLGSDALALVRAKLKAALAGLASHEALTRSTDGP